MTDPDFNLLTALDALLSTGSVAGAARRLGLSASAMSRTLSRLRTATGDPLLVRAGRHMVLTPYAETLRERARNAVFEARALLRPTPNALDPATLDRTFTLRANDGFVEAFGPALIAAAAVVDGIGMVWLIAALGPATTLLQWLACYLVLAAYAGALCGLAGMHLVFFASRRIPLAGHLIHVGVLGVVHRPAPPSPPVPMVEETG